MMSHFFASKKRQYSKRLQKTPRKLKKCAYSEKPKINDQGKDKIQFSDPGPKDSSYNSKKMTHHLETPVCRYPDSGNAHPRALMYAHGAINPYPKQLSCPTTSQPSMVNYQTASKPTVYNPNQTIASSNLPNNGQEMNHGMLNQAHNFPPNVPNVPFPNYYQSKSVIPISSNAQAFQGIIANFLIGDYMNQYFQSINTAIPNFIASLLDRIKVKIEYFKNSLNFIVSNPSFSTKEFRDAFF